MRDIEESKQSRSEDEGVKSGTDTSLFLWRGFVSFLDAARRGRPEWNLLNRSHLFVSQEQKPKNHTVKCCPKKPIRHFWRTENVPDFRKEQLQLA